MYAESATGTFDRASLVPHPNLSDKVNHNIIQSEIEGGVYLRDLRPGAVLAIQTRNRSYTLVRLNDELGVDLGPSGILPRAGGSAGPGLHLGRFHAEGEIRGAGDASGVYSSGTSHRDHVADRGHPARLNVAGADQRPFSAAFLRPPWRRARRSSSSSRCTALNGRWGIRTSSSKTRSADVFSLSFPDVRRSALPSRSSALKASASAMDPGARRRSRRGSIHSALGRARCDANDDAVLDSGGSRK